MKPTLIVLTVCGLLGSVQSTYAKPPFLKKAKELNLPGITNCQACHISTEKPDVKWNDRGLWLKAKKQELKAEEVDVAWLKDYKPAS